MDLKIISSRLNNKKNRTTVINFGEIRDRCRKSKVKRKVDYDETTANLEHDVKNDICQDIASSNHISAVCRALHHDERLSRPAPSAVSLGWTCNSTGVT